MNPNQHISKRKNNVNNGFMFKDKSKEQILTAALSALAREQLQWSKRIRRGKEQIK